MPPVVWRSNVEEIGAAALYVAELGSWRSQNGRLLRAPGTRPSLVQHYWSPGLEEQFYLRLADPARRGAWLRRAGPTRHRPDSRRGHARHRPRSVLASCVCVSAPPRRRASPSSAPGRGPGSSPSAAWSPCCRRWPMLATRASAAVAAGGPSAGADRPCLAPVDHATAFPGLADRSSRRWEPRWSSRAGSACSRAVVGLLGCGVPCSGSVITRTRIYLWHWPPAGRRCRGSSTAQLGNGVARGHPGRHACPGLDDQGAGGGPSGADWQRRSGAAGRASGWPPPGMCLVLASTTTVGATVGELERHASTVRGHPDHEQRAMRGLHRRVGWTRGADGRTPDRADAKLAFAKDDSDPAIRGCQLGITTEPPSPAGASGRHTTSPTRTIAVVGNSFAGPDRHDR